MFSETIKEPNPRKIIYKMLVVRHYIVDNYDDFINSSEEIYLTHKINNPNDKIYIFFPSASVKSGTVSNKVGVTPVRQYVQQMKDNNVGRAIVVVKDTVTAFAKLIIGDEKDLIIECFHVNELLIDKLEHVLVPKHELISDDEKKEIMEIYNFKENQFSRILSTDPIARYFGAAKGQVFKITRCSESAGSYFHYRMVV